MYEDKNMSNNNLMQKFILMIDRKYFYKSPYWKWRRHLLTYNCCTWIGTARQISTESAPGKRTHLSNKIQLSASFGDVVVDKIQSNYLWIIIFEVWIGYNWGGYKTYTCTLWSIKTVQFKMLNLRGLDIICRFWYSR